MSEIFTHTHTHTKGSQSTQTMSLIDRKQTFFQGWPKGEINILILVLWSGFTGILLSVYDAISALFNKKCKLIRLSPMGDCINIPLLSYSLDDVKALRAKLWQ